MEAEYDLGLCTHAALSPHKCMTIPDGESEFFFRYGELPLSRFWMTTAQNDWRFQNHVSRERWIYRTFY